VSTESTDCSSGPALTATTISAFEPLLDRCNRADLPGSVVQLCQWSTKGLQKSPRENHREGSCRAPPRTARFEYLTRLQQDRIALVDEVDRPRGELARKSPKSASEGAPKGDNKRLPLCLARSVGALPIHGVWHRYSGERNWSVGRQVLSTVPCAS
jgi:hypothetical protein